MTRRKFFGFLASLPLVGALFPRSPGAAYVLDVPNALFLPKGIYAAAGETVTCTAGHPICDFIETVKIGQIQDVKRQLGNWRQPEPQIGQLDIPPCQVCGNPWIAGGMVYHVGDSWRDPFGHMKA